MLLPIPDDDNDDNNNANMRICNIIIIIKKHGRALAQG